MFAEGTPIYGDLKLPEVDISCFQCGFVERAAGVGQSSNGIQTSVALLIVPKSSIALSTRKNLVKFVRNAENFKTSLLDFEIFYFFSLHLFIRLFTLFYIWEGGGCINIYPYNLSGE